MNLGTLWTRSPEIGPASQPIGHLWNRCPAYSYPDGGACDLRRHHDGPHVAERGLDADIVWMDVYL